MIPAIRAMAAVLKLFGPIKPLHRSGGKPSEKSPAEAHPQVPAQPQSPLGNTRQVDEIDFSHENYGPLAAIVRYSNDAILAFDLKGNVKSWNAAAVKLFGFSREEIIGRSIDTFVPDEKRSELRGLINTVMGGGAVDAFETVRLRKDGSLIDVSVTISPLKNARGEVIGLSGIIRNIGERKQMDRQIELHAQMLAQVSDALIATDLDHHITYWNKGAEKLLGYTSEEVMGRPKHDVLKFNEGEDDETRFFTVLKLGGAWSGERVTFGKGDKRLDVALSVKVLKDKDGGPMGLLMVMHDFSARKKAEEDLKRQAEELARSNEQLVQFAYVASHDLKEPLRMVTHFVQLLEKKYKGKLDRDADEYIDYAVGGAVRMYDLINDLLIYSRVGTSKNKKLLPTNCDLLLDRVIYNLQFSIQESGAIVERNPMPTLMVDPTQMTQLLQNLVSNAIKFRGADKPVVQIESMKRAGEWLFCVSDNGIGIDSKFSERIFVIFQRLHSREDYPGTGIGLAICKKIVEGHGGKIWVESYPGKGARFYFSIPERERIPAVLHQAQA